MRKVARDFVNIPMENGNREKSEKLRLNALATGVVASFRVYLPRNAIPLLAHFRKSSPRRAKSFCGKVVVFKGVDTRLAQMPTKPSTSLAYTRPRKCIVQFCRNAMECPSGIIDFRYREISHSPFISQRSARKRLFTLFFCRWSYFQ